MKGVVKFFQDRHQVSIDLYFNTKSIFPTPRTAPACKPDFDPKRGFYLNKKLVGSNVQWLSYPSGSAIKVYSFPIKPSLSGAQVNLPFHHWRILFDPGNVSPPKYLCFPRPL